MLIYIWMQTECRSRCLVAWVCMNEMVRERHAPCRGKTSRYSRTQPWVGTQPLTLLSTFISSCISLSSSASTMKQSCTALIHRLSHMFPINIQSPRSNNNGQLPLLPNTHYIHARSSFPHAPPMSESVSKRKRKHKMRTKSVNDMLICTVSACMHH